MPILSDITQGTISIAADGTAVTGVGTAFQTGGFQEGDLLFANGYQGVVLSVTSNTALTLAQPWKGGALSGASYRLRYQGDASRLTSMARQLITLLGSGGNIEALAGLVGAANKFPVFTGAGTMGLATIADFALTFLDETTGGGVYGALGEIPNGSLPNRLRAIGATVTNLDTITESGFYVATTGATGHPGSGVVSIFHQRISSTTDIQTAALATGVTYIRYRTGSSWGTWKRNLVSDDTSALLPPTSFPDRLKETVVAVPDLNADLPNGIFYTAAADPNRPITASGNFYVLNFRFSGEYQRQIAFSSNQAASRMYVREKKVNVWGDWSLMGIPILGAVSQSSGVPSGALIERGSNANGEYVRYADGTQVCWTSGISLTKAAGLVEVQWIYPITFLGTPTVSATLNARTADGGIGRTAYSVGVSAPNNIRAPLVFSQMDGATAQTGTWSGNSAMAIGRWF